MVVVRRWRRVLWFSKNIFYIQEKVLKKKLNKYMYNLDHETQVMSEEA